MKYYSTSNKNIRSDLKEVVFKGLAPDGGLYMPENIPSIPDPELNEIFNEDFKNIAYRLSSRLFSDDIPDEDLKQLAYESLNFDTPLKKIKDNIYCLELFHGPTLAFKDVGARFMARMLSFLTRGYNREIHVLVATSGDTGSAVANGFLGVDGVKVHILYPQGLVSPLQEKQFTTLGENITALEIRGSFDDCQQLVKKAFNDDSLKERITLSSANSINLARLLPQSFYYFNALAQLEERQNVVFCVPSGNFGNLTAGLIAKRMGLPVDHFLAATNSNDVVPQYLESAQYSPRPSVATIANAMDVGNPSNFARILDLYHHSHREISREISGFSYPDSQIKKTMAEVYQETGYLLDPHGATGFRASEAYLGDHPGSSLIFLETAHPAKFRETVEEVSGKKIDLPDRLKKFEDKEKKSLVLENSYDVFSEYLKDIS